jgi:hypothetical protein
VQLAADRRTILFSVLESKGCEKMSRMRTFLVFLSVSLSVSRFILVADAFSDFKLRFPWDSASGTETSRSGPGSTALQRGDTIAVIGASGNVGKLVSLRLSDNYKVNGIVRDSASKAKVLPFVGERVQKDEIRLVECNLLEEALRKKTAENSVPYKYPSSLETALKNANALVICTGTTAFPTKAWSRSSSSETSVTNAVLMALVNNAFSKEDALADLDAKGYNTPNNIDNFCNGYILDAWDKISSVPQKRVIMLSSIGVQRRETMPFPVLNACGVLDAKAQGEEAVKAAAANGGYSYTILRPGQLFGGPYDNNYYLGTLFQLDKGASSQDIQVALGDELLGDTLRTTLAEVTAQIFELDCAKDIDFAVVNVKGVAPSVEQVQERLQTLK